MCATHTQQSIICEEEKKNSTIHLS